VLKLDLKFLDDKNETGRGGNILNSVVRMAKWMHLPVVVEGVETRQQVDFLRTIGCDYIQGYYFSRPIPVEDYEHLLAQRTFVPILGKESQWLDAQDLKELLNPSRSFNLLFNSMIGGVGLYEMMTGGSIELIRANDGFFRLMQSSKEDIDRIDMLSYIMDEDRKKILRAIRESGDRKKLTECIVRRRLPDGTFLWLRARVSSLFTDASRRLFFIGWDDVSSQYNLPLQLQAMTDQFQNGIVMSQLINGELYLNYANRWMLELDGLDPDSRRGQGLVPMTNIMDKELVEKFKEAILKHVESGSGVPLAIEYPFEASDGTTRRLRCYLNAAKTSENHYSVLASVHDITNETK
jgi:PAS domain-containing protein